MAIDATTEFDAVQGTFTTSALPILTTLEDIALDAVKLAIGSNPAAQVAYLSDAAILGETGFTNVTDVPDPVAPDDPAIFQQAIDFLNWLQAQALAEAGFPGYEFIVTDPPAAPALDTSDPEFYTLSEIADPVYDVPAWDGDWTGGDVTNDATVAPLVKAFVWPGTTYTSKLMVSGSNVLYEKVKADLQSSTYGVDTLDDGRVFERARERETEQMSAAIGDAVRIFSGGGFEMPPGAAAAAVNRIQMEARDRITAASRDILSAKAALLLEAKRLALATGTQIETLEQGFYHAEADRLLKRLAQEITSTVEVAAHNVARIRMHIDRYAAFARVFGERVAAAKGVVDLFSARVSAEGVKAQVNRTLVDNLIAKNKNLIDIFMTELEAYKSQVDGRVRYHSVLADVFKSKVSQINAYTDATKGAFELVDKQHRTLVDFEIGKYNGRIAAMKSKLDEIVAALTVKVDQLKNEAQSAASVAAAAMSAMNVNLGLSLSGSTSIGGSETYSHDATKSTSPGATTQNIHSWDETKSTSPGTQRTITEYDGSHTVNNYNYVV